LKTTFNNNNNRNTNISILKAKKGNSDKITIAPSRPYF